MVLPRRLVLTLPLILASTAYPAEFPGFEPQTLDPHVGNVCYAVTTADVNGDGKLDAVAVAEDAVYWYANPSWQKQTIIKNATEKDNVCIQAHDIDGDGKIDFSLGASWQPSNTKSGGTIQWLRRGGDDSWSVAPIGSEPTVHRMRWGDVLGVGKKQLVVAPLQGRGTKGPNWGAGNGVRILVYTVPADPLKDKWTFEVADDSLHATHNFQLVDLNNDGKVEIVVASWEGVFVLQSEGKGQWEKRRLGTGNQSSSPSKGSSEVKVGKFAGGLPYLATIEPWHGNQVVVYTTPSLKKTWDRHVIDEPVPWGHAVWCADLDGDGDDELVIGQRDPSKDPSRSPKGPGVFVYDLKPGLDPGSPPSFTRHVIDDGGIGCEDLVVADLNADGRPDILAGGRSSHNVKVYWNRGR